MRVTRTTLAWTVLLVSCSMVVPASTHAQCEGCATAVSGACNGASGCSGRCTYGVEGTCTPKRSTYGHYQTKWRQWKEPAPYVPKRPKRSSQLQRNGEGQVELPPAIDESEINPEFPPLKQSSSSNYSGASDLSVGVTEGYAEGDYIVVPNEPVEAAAPSSPAVDLPTPEAEIGGGVMDEGAAPAPDLDFETRGLSQSSDRYALRSDSLNPLRRMSPVSSTRQASHTSPASSVRTEIRTRSDQRVSFNGVRRSAPQPPVQVKPPVLTVDNPLR